MSTPEATPTLALPSGAADRPRHVLNLATLLLGVAMAMAFSALLAAYLNLRSLTEEWPPEDVSLDNYRGVTLAITLLLSVATAEWAPYALKRDNRRHALSGFAFTIGWGLSFFVLLWFLVAELGFGPADHAYGTVAYALLAAAGINLVVGLVYVLVALLRVAGHQVTAADRELARAAAWYWQFVVITWLIAFSALYLLQNK